jgi:hypothetical protein
MITSLLTQWVSLQSAAQVLGMTPAALRKSLDRRAARTSDGGIEAEIDGVRGRKFGRLWRVVFSPAWTLPLTSNDVVQSAPSQSVRADRKGFRS